MINVIAIDDEPLALIKLQQMIEATPFFHLVAACQSAFDAMNVLQQASVDAIFADINMPDLSGLDFVRTLPKPPIIVFTTAYEKYAIEGYKVSAVDYLLKPYSHAEFLQAAAKVKHQYELLHPSKTESLVATSNTGKLEGDMLFIKDGYSIVRISISDIRYVESQSEYLKIHMTDGGSHMVLMSIKSMAELLPEEKFIRIHRSYIVNMSKVVEIARLRLRMDAGTLLPIGDSYKDATLKFINDRMIGR